MPKAVSYGQPRLAAASATGQDAGPRGDAERFTHDAAMRPSEPVTPASFFQIGGAGRIVGEKSLKLRERSWEWQVGSVENVHDSPSVLCTQSILGGYMRKADRHGSDNQSQLLSPKDFRVLT